MFATLFLLFASTFAETKALAVQIHLDRAGYSCSAIDGVWGPKAQFALKRFMIDNRLLSKDMPVPSPDVAFNLLFADKPDPFRIVEVTQADLDAIVSIPEDPAARARLPRMGYESIKEMFAERGHLSQIALVKMNPGVDWKNIRPGTKLVIPDFPSVEEEFKAADRGRPNRPKRPKAALVRISVSGCTITAIDAKGKVLLQLPCSIAANKTKVPPHGELKITSYVPWPNYTYTPDYTPKGRKVQRYVWPSGENCPVGIAWMGLNLPGYGIHGTPRPESIGFTGSHGCFRLANWNAARLFAMCKSGTRVVIEP